MKWKFLLCLLLLVLQKTHAVYEPDDEQETEEEVEEEEQGGGYEEDDADVGPTEAGFNVGGDEDIFEHPTPESTTTTTTEATTTLDYCHCEFEKYYPADTEGTLKSPNYPGAHCNSGKCMYDILPHPNMSIRLNVDTAELSAQTFLKFFNIIEVNGKMYYMYHSEFGNYRIHDFYSYNHLTTAVNVGIRVVFEMQKNTYAYSGFKITFERVKDDTTNYVCPDAHVIVGESETSVSVPKTFSVTSGCTILLSPSVRGLKDHEDEMLIDIESNDDTYVSIRSYNAEGMFTRDIFQRENRSKLVDASRVEVLFRQTSSSEGNYITPRITARLMNKTCTCPPNVLNITVGSHSVTVRSPGFPDLYCPMKQCHTFIQIDKNEKLSDNIVPLLLIQSNCSLSENDILSLISTDSGRPIFRVRHTDHVSTKVLRPLVINEQNLEVSFGASSKKQLRYFEMSIIRVLVERECTCSVFDDKEYKDSGFLSVPIPGHCSFMHCHWKFSAGHEYPPKYMSIEFSMSNPLILDSVFVVTEKLTEEYNADLLTGKRSITSVSSPIEFTFSRFGLISENESVLNVTWKVVPACSCPAEKFYVEVDEPAVVASPNYPDMYCPNLVCRHVFYAPPGHYLHIQLDNIDLEKFHDFLKIYDGNSSIDPEIARITGTRHHVAFNSTGETLFILFDTDGSTGAKGYHANVYARPGSALMNGSNTVYWVLFIIFVVVIVGAAIGASVHFYRKKPGAPGTTDGPSQREKKPDSVANPNAETHEDNGISIPMEENPAPPTSTPPRPLIVL